MPPVVAAGNHIHCGAGSFVDHHVLHGGAGGHCLVDGRLELDFVAAAVARVLGDDGDAAAVGNAVGDGVSGEPAEDDGVDCSDARAGEQSDGEFRRHAHVDGDAIAFPDAKRLEGAGEFLHFGVEFGVGEAANLAGLALPDERGFVRAFAEGMTVDTVVAEVHFAADEPLCPGKIPLKNFVPGLEPVQFFRHAGPELFGIGD